MVSMTNEQKRQLLEHLGYQFIISNNPLRQASYVQTPDGWIKYAEYSDALSPEYDSVTLGMLINMAWKHHEVQELSE
jgi:hypothetical protein